MQRMTGNEVTPFTPSAASTRLGASRGGGRSPPIRCVASKCHIFHEPSMNDTAKAPVAGFRYYDFLLGGMVAVLLCSNLIGPGKVCSITLPLFGPLDFGAGNLFFPLSYIFEIGRASCRERVCKYV